MMTDKETINQALRDATEWQRTLADAYRHSPGSIERRDALAQAKRYDALLKKRTRQT